MSDTLSLTDAYMQGKRALDEYTEKCGRFLNSFAYQMFDRGGLDRSRWEYFKPGELFKPGEPKNPDNIASSITRKPDRFIEVMVRILLLPNAKNPPLLEFPIAVRNDAGGWDVAVGHGDDKLEFRLSSLNVPHIFDIYAKVRQAIVDRLQDQHDAHTAPSSPQTFVLLDPSV